MMQPTCQVWVFITFCNFTASTWPPGCLLLNEGTLECSWPWVSFFLRDIYLRSRSFPPTWHLNQESWLLLRLANVWPTDVRCGGEDGGPQRDSSALLFQYLKGCCVFLNWKSASWWVELGPRVIFHEISYSPNYSRSLLRIIRKQPRAVGRELVDDLLYIWSLSFTQLLSTLPLLPSQVPFVLV